MSFRSFRKKIRIQLISFLVMGPLVFPQALWAQIPLNLPLPGVMVTPSGSFMPVMMNGLTLDTANPLAFDFIIHAGDTGLAGDDLREESDKLVKYFLAALTVPEEELWVNLSPYEEDRVITERLGITGLGRDLLAQDYLLKQLTSSLMHPGETTGQNFWERVGQQMKALGADGSPDSHSLHKIWIVPAKAVVYQHGATAYVIESSLKVMLEEDYMAYKAEKTGTGVGGHNAAAATEAMRMELLPAIEREVNTGAHFAPLRQIYNAIILASWYKDNLRDSVLSQVYVDQGKTRGIESDDPDAPRAIYQRYLDAIRAGVVDVITEDYDPQAQNLVTRQYFTGGADLTDAAMVTKTVDSGLGSAAFRLASGANQVSVSLETQKDAASPAQLARRISNPTTRLAERLADSPLKDALNKIYNLMIIKKQGLILNLGLNPKEFQNAVNFGSPSISFIPLHGKEGEQAYRDRESGDEDIPEGAFRPVLINDANGQPQELVTEIEPGGVINKVKIEVYYQFSTEGQVVFGVRMLPGDRQNFQWEESVLDSIPNGDPLMVENLLYNAIYSKSVFEIIRALKIVPAVVNIPDMELFHFNQVMENEIREKREKGESSAFSGVNLVFLKATPWTIRERDPRDLLPNEKRLIPLIKEKLGKKVFPYEPDGEHEIDILRLLEESPVVGALVIDQDPREMKGHEGDNNSKVFRPGDFGAEYVVGDLLDELAKGGTLESFKMGKRGNYSANAAMMAIEIKQNQIRALLTDKGGDTDEFKEIVEGLKTQEWLNLLRFLFDLRVVKNDEEKIDAFIKVLVDAVWNDLYDLTHRNIKVEGLGDIKSSKTLGLETLQKALTLLNPKNNIYSMKITIVRKALEAVQEEVDQAMESVKQAIYNGTITPELIRNLNKISWEMLGDFIHAEQEMITIKDDFYAALGLVVDHFWNQDGTIFQSEQMINMNDWQHRLEWLYEALTMLNKHIGRARYPLRGEKYLDESKEVRARLAKVNEMLLSFRQEVKPRGDDAEVGGIDLSRSVLGLDVRGDGEGMVSPVFQNAPDLMNVDGFFPVIINIQPIPNLPLLLGIAEPTGATYAVRS